MANVAYNIGKAVLASGGGWASLGQTFRVLLATSAYSPDPAHQYVSDVIGELSGGGYARQDLAGRAVNVDQLGGKADCLASNVALHGLSSAQSYRWLVVFHQNTSDADSELLCALDMSGISLAGITDHVVKWDGQAATGRVFSLL